MSDYTTDELTLDGARQDWAIVINPDADYRQRQLCMQRMASVDIQTSGRLISPLIHTALDNLDQDLLEEVTALMLACFSQVMADVVKAMAQERKRG